LERRVNPKYEGIKKTPKEGCGGGFFKIPKPFPSVLKTPNQVRAYYKSSLSLSTKESSSKCFYPDM
jgi:hypothetical protein